MWTAARLLRHLDVDLPETRSYRSDGRLRLTDVTDLRAGVMAAIKDALTFEGSVGVIVPDGHVVEFEDERVSVMPVSMVKGLEYDHVILVEPADIVEAETRGLNRLYVALTRAVSRLDVLSSRAWTVMPAS